MTTYPDVGTTRGADRPGGGASLLLVAVLCLVIGFLLHERVAGWLIGPGTPASEPRAILPRGDLSAAETSQIELFEQTSPSVVFITTLAGRRDRFTGATSEIPSGTGSGFVWDDAGHIVTNAHVLAGASGARVTLYDQSTYNASLVGVAPDYDLAVLRIDAPRTRLRPIAVGTSADLRVGQSVYAIGNPFGLDQTLTTGVVSALGRIIPGLTGREIENVVQTDAAINPGNSGGPLLDSAGRLIGVNTQIASPSGASAGIGFAVPVDTVNRIVPQLIRSGRVVRPHLGVAFHPTLDRAFRQRFGVEGALIFRVEPGSPADAAGLRGTMHLEDGRWRVGDVVQAIEGQPVTSPEEFLAVMTRYDPGQTVTLTVLREGQSVTVGVTLGASG